MSDDPHENVLTSLVGDVQGFRDRFWQRQPYYRSNALEPDSPFQLSWSEIESLVANPLMRTPFFVVVKDGERIPETDVTTRLMVGGEALDDVIDLKAVLALFESGGTIMIRNVSDQLDDFGDVCRLLGLELGSPGVLSFLFVTPQNAQGFDWHRDPQEIFILQLYGEKMFDIASEGTVDGRSGRLAADEVSANSWPVSTLTLQAGDVLYLPSGCPHRARTSGAAGSVHVSLNLERHVWLQLLGGALREGASSLPRLAPMQPSVEDAQAWLRELGSAAAERVRSVTTRPRKAPFPRRAVLDVLQSRVRGDQ